MKRLGAVLFSNGWGFFIPALSVYLVAWGLDVSALVTRNIVFVLNLAIAGLFAVYLWKIRKEISGSEFAFWAGLFLLLLIPGAYLEFPSDPWEHVRRIFLWDNAVGTAHGSLKFKYAYFLNWSTIFWVPFEQRHLAFDVLSAFWQWIFAFQVYRFCRRLGFEGWWGRLQVLGVICLFGVNVFSIRYYALSTIPLAYVGYLGALGLFIDAFKQGKYRVLLLLPFAGALALFNHPGGTV